MGINELYWCKIDSEYRTLVTFYGYFSWHLGLEELYRGLRTNKIPQDVQCMCQTSKNSWESNYTECCLIINPNGQLWSKHFLTTLRPPDSALQSLLDSLQKNRCSALGWEINSYHSYVPKIQGPSAAVLRMLINSSPYAPKFLQFQSIVFSQDLGPQICFESPWG